MPRQKHKAYIGVGATFTAKGTFEGMLKYQMDKMLPHSSKQPGKIKNGLATSGSMHIENISNMFFSHVGYEIEYENDNVLKGFADGTKLQLQGGKQDFRRGESQIDARDFNDQIEKIGRRPLIFLGDGQTLRVKSDKVINGKRDPYAKYIFNKLRERNLKLEKVHCESLEELATKLLLQEHGDNVNGILPSKFRNRYSEQIVRINPQPLPHDPTPATRITRVIYHPQEHGALFRFKKICKDGQQLTEAEISAFNLLQAIAMQQMFMDKNINGDSKYIPIYRRTRDYDKDEMSLEGEGIKKFNVKLQEMSPDLVRFELDSNFWDVAFPAILNKLDLRIASIFNDIRFFRSAVENYFKSAQKQNYKFKLLEYAILEIVKPKKFFQVKFNSIDKALAFVNKITPYLIQQKIKDANLITAVTPPMVRLSEEQFICLLKTNSDYNGLVANFDLSLINDLIKGAQSVVPDPKPLLIVSAPQPVFNFGLYESLIIKPVSFDLIDSDKSEGLYAFHFIETKNAHNFAKWAERALKGTEVADIDKKILHIQGKNLYLNKQQLIALLYPENFSDHRTDTENELLADVNKAIFSTQNLARPPSSSSVQQVKTTGVSSNPPTKPLPKTPSEAKNKQKVFDFTPFRGKLAEAVGFEKQNSIEDPDNLIGGFYVINFTNSDDARKFAASAKDALDKSGILNREEIKTSATEPCVVRLTEIQLNELLHPDHPRHGAVSQKDEKLLEEVNKALYSQEKSSKATPLQPAFKFNPYKDSINKIELRAGEIFVLKFKDQQISNFIKEAKSALENTDADEKEPSRDGLEVKLTREQLIGLLDPYKSRNFKGLQNAALLDKVNGRLSPLPFNFTLYKNKMDGNVVFENVPNNLGSYVFKFKDLKDAADFAERAKDTLAESGLLGFDKINQSKTNKSIVRLTQQQLTKLLNPNQVVKNDLSCFDQRLLNAINNILGEKKSLPIPHFRFNLYRNAMDSKVYFEKINGDNGFYTFNFTSPENATNFAKYAKNALIENGLLGVNEINPTETNKSIVRLTQQQLIKLLNPNQAVVNDLSRNDDNLLNKVNNAINSKVKYVAGKDAEHKQSIEKRIQALTDDLAKSKGTYEKNKSENWGFLRKLILGTYRIETKLEFLNAIIAAYNEGGKTIKQATRETMQKDNFIRKSSVCLSGMFSAGFFSNRTTKLLENIEPSLVKEFAAAKPKNP